MMNRRDFFSSFARTIFLILLSAISGFFVFKNYNGAENTCQLDFVCKNCKKVKSCSLNEAVQFKKVNNQ